MADVDHLLCDVAETPTSFLFGAQDFGMPNATALEPPLWSAKSDELFSPQDAAELSTALEHFGLSPVGPANARLLSGAAPVGAMGLVEPLAGFDGVAFLRGGVASSKKVPKGNAAIKSVGHASIEGPPRHILAPSTSGMSQAERNAMLGRRKATGDGGGACKTSQRNLNLRTTNRRNDPMETVGILTGRTHGTGQSNAKSISKDLFAAVGKGRRRGEVTLDRVCRAPANADIPIVAARWRRGHLFTIASFVPYRKPRAKAARAQMVSRVEVHGEPEADRLWDEALSQRPHGGALSGGDAVRWAYHNVIDREGVGCVWQMKPPSGRS
eukprot:CAMPEP_0182926678 /NCGR_PEP_ID=MMETSP0105_2-20130417/12206_1 /TAXON_ID=81532 ORGANISM="Acanthoeca-like sp., Strain 10tr" /NCGR_SAMPLE_ID=MMETSP0105_2 /ASSEMBLY_ACC=CAM_ASM_000205 /LENGTH=325 /DNA_ID=CAMNT_0025064579 /DNA_START=121 /DNA_END=1099 /DNA_ORIENTATION=-